MPRGKSGRGKSSSGRTAWLARRKKRKIKKYETLIKNYPSGDISIWQEKLKFWKIQ